MVVGIHIPLWGTTSIMKPLYSIAVPIFLMISGYFLVTPEGDIPQKRITKILKKIFTITVIVNLIYYGWRVLIHHVYTLPIFRTILVGDTLNLALWYMNAYLEALILIWFITKLKLTRLLPWLAILGLLLNLILGSYYWVFLDKRPELYLEGVLIPNALHRNFFTIALPCIVAGTWLRLKERPQSLRKLLWAAGILLIANYAEAIIRKLACGSATSGDIGLVTLPLAIVVFLIALNLKSEHRLIRYLAHLGKNYSTNIFLFHLLINGILFILVTQLPFWLPDNIYWMLPVDIILIIFLTKICNLGKLRFFFEAKKLSDSNISSSKTYNN